jgi:hypothetical protein
MLTRNRLLAVGLVALLAVRAPAEEWAVLGSRAMGMGGAGVAVTRGGLSSYWNPAGLAPPHAPRAPTFWDVAVPGSFNAAATNNFLREVDDVASLVEDLNFDSLDQALNDPGVTLTPVQLQKTLQLLVEELPDLGAKGTGVVANASAGVMARVWQFGFSALGISHAGGITRIDLDNIALGDEGVDGIVGPGSDRSGQLSGAGQTFADQLASDGVTTQNQAEEIVFQAEQAGINVSSSTNQARIREILVATQANQGGSAANSFTSNQSGLDLRGILLQEYAVSFAQPFFEIVSVGVNLKLLSGWTYFKPYNLRDLETFSGNFKDLFDEDNREESVNFGVDAGVLVQPLPWLSLGVVGRNLNSPKFEFKGPGDYEIERQFRAGAGVNVVPGLTLAVDIDLVRNESAALPGYHSQVLGGGAEFAILDAVFLRAGVSKNLAEENEDIMIHAGLGARFWIIDIDAAASFVPDWTEVTTGNDGDDPTQVPERVGASLQIGFNLPLD